MAWRCVKVDGLLGPSPSWATALLEREMGHPIHSYPSSTALKMRAQPQSDRAMSDGIAKPAGLSLQVLPQELGERRNIRLSSGGEPVSFLESFQRLLGGGPHLAIDRTGIMASALEFAL